jgi:glycosyltransferase involved in cell wall biosynthesis
LRRLIIISLNADPIRSFGTEHGGGQAKYILELGKNLVLAGWCIDVITIKNYGHSEIQCITENFNIYRFSLPRHKDYSYSINESDIEFLSKNVIKFLRQNHFSYDLIFCCYWLSGIVGLKIKNEFLKNVLISFCSLGYFKKMGSKQPINIESRIATEIIIAKKVDHIIATSKEEKKVLTSIYKVSPDKISIIPRGIDLNVFYKF